MEELLIDARNQRDKKQRKRSISGAAPSKTPMRVRRIPDDQDDLVELEDDLEDIEIPKRKAVHHGPKRKAGYHPKGKKPVLMWFPVDLVERMDQMEVSRAALAILAIHRYLKGEE